MKKNIYIFLIIYLLAFSNTVLCFCESSLDVILFSRYTQNNWQIWLKRIDSGEEKQLTNSNSDKRHPCLVPEEKLLFFRTSNGELFEYNLSTLSEKRILNQFHRIMKPKWSLDGKSVTFSRLRDDLVDDSDIWICSRSGDFIRCILDDEGLQYSPVFSPDNQWIAYVSTMKPRGHNIFLIDREGRNKRELTRGTAYDEDPQFSPDGSEIVFSSDRESNYDIWLCEIATAGLIKLTRYKGMDNSPVFSPDGTKIFFTSNRSGIMQIWSMDKSGNNVKMYTQMESAPCMDPFILRIPESIYTRIKERE